MSRTQYKEIYLQNGINHTLKKKKMSSAKFWFYESSKGAAAYSSFRCGQKSMCIAKSVSSLHVDGL